MDDTNSLDHPERRAAVTASIVHLLDQCAGHTRAIARAAPDGPELPTIRGAVSSLADAAGLHVTGIPATPVSPVQDPPASPPTA